MNLTLTDYTGKGFQDPGGYAARLMIRARNAKLGYLDIDDPYLSCMNDRAMYSHLEFLARTPQASWSMVRYVFHIEGVSRLLAGRLRATPWATVVERSLTGTRLPLESDIEDFAFVPDDNKFMKADLRYIRSLYKIGLEHGTSKRDMQYLLPQAVKTDVFFSIDLRALTYFVRENSGLDKPQELTRLCAEIMLATMKAHPWADMFFKGMDPQAWKDIEQTVKAFNLSTDAQATLLEKIRRFVANEQR